MVPMKDRFGQRFISDTSQVSVSTTLVGGVYQRLRADIVEGRLKPNERLRTEHLKEVFEVGAATVREALALLVADTLVVSQQQRGFRVAPMSIADFEDITETRATLEAHAVRLSVMKGDDDWEAELSGAFHRLSRAESRLRRGEIEMDDWEGSNRRFHETLIGASGSDWARHFIAILYRQSERYRRLAIENAPPQRDVHEEHEAIFEAAINRNVELVGDLIARHVRLTLNVIREVPCLYESSDSTR